MICLICKRVVANKRIVKNFSREICYNCNHLSLDHVDSGKCRHSVSGMPSNCECKSFYPQPLIEEYECSACGAVMQVRALLIRDEQISAVRLKKILNLPEVKEKEKK